MAIRVAINGFGRIGRLTLRAALESGRKDLEFVAINDLGPLGETWSANSLSYADGRIYHRTAAELLCIGRR